MFLSTDPKRCSKLAPGITRSRTSRKGVDVDTLDIDPELKPTYLADIREPFTLPRRYDVVRASEVLEHMPIGMPSNLPADSGH